MSKKLFNVSLMKTTAALLLIVYAVDCVLSDVVIKRIMVARRRTNLSAVSRLVDSGSIEQMEARYDQAPDDIRDELAFQIGNAHRRVAVPNWETSSTVTPSTAFEQQHLIQSKAWYERVLRFPGSAYAPDASSWIAGIELRLGFPEKALKQYQMVAATWPTWQPDLIDSSIHLCLRSLRTQYGGDLGGAPSRAIDVNGLVARSFELPHEFRGHDWMRVTKAATSALVSVVMQSGNVEFSCGNYKAAAARYEMAARLCSGDQLAARHHGLLTAVACWLLVGESDRADLAMKQAKSLRPHLVWDQTRSEQGDLNTRWRLVDWLWTTGRHMEAARLARDGGDMATSWYELESKAQNMKVLGACVMEPKTADHVRAYLDYCADSPKLNMLASGIAGLPLSELARATLCFRSVDAGTAVTCRNARALASGVHDQGLHRSLTRFAAERSMSDSWLREFAVGRKQFPADPVEVACQALDQISPKTRTRLAGRIASIVKWHRQNKDLSEVLTPRIVRDAAVSVLKECAAETHDRVFAAECQHAIRAVDAPLSGPDIRKRLEWHVFEHFNDPIGQGDGGQRVGVSNLMPLLAGFELQISESDGSTQLRQAIEFASLVRRASSAFTNPVWKSPNDRYNYLSSAWWLEYKYGFAKRIINEDPVIAQATLLRTRMRDDWPAADRRVLAESASSALDDAAHRYGSILPLDEWQRSIRQSVDLLHSAEGPQLNAGSDSKTHVRRFEHLERDRRSLRMDDKIGWVLGVTDSPSEEGWLGGEIEVVNGGSETTNVDDTASGFADCAIAVQARDAFWSRDYAASTHLFKALLTRYPRSHHRNEALFSLATVCERTGDVGGTTAYLLRAAVNSPRRIRVAALRGLLRFLGARRDIRRLELLETVIHRELAGSLLEEEAAITMADLLFANRKFAEALTRYRRLQNEARSASGAYLLLRSLRCCQALGHATDAALLKQALIKRYSGERVGLDGELVTIGSGAGVEDDSSRKSQTGRALNAQYDY